MKKRKKPVWRRAEDFAVKIVSIRAFVSFFNEPGDDRLDEMRHFVRMGYYARWIAAKRDAKKDGGAA